MTNPSVAKYANEIYQIIKSHHRFLLTTHVRADGDGIGAEIALFHLLKNMGKSVSIVNDSLIPQIYKFITPSSGIYVYPDVPHDKPEVVFALDCPTLERLGKTTGFFPEGVIIINIDHHIANENFGKINWVADDMCATGDVVLQLLRETKVDITPDMATALYVSIVTDTGRFTHSNTTSSTLRSAAFLIECGARHTDITRCVYSANSYNLIQLNAQSLATIRLHLGNQVATIWLTREMLEKTKVNAIDTHDFADIPSSIEGVAVGVLLREMTKPDWVKVSLRSQNGLQVNTIAQKYGGGGHKYAAGCEIQGSIEAVQQTIIRELGKVLPQKS
ncbi:MAG: bifunctional oligoribonuclease/PAP phosphatase NrnA [Planctomycetes bacterium]|nr:bifunctional oligoribonuclease/PAP phosphatase NrnA [Planctomycetota bacterium]